MDDFKISNESQRRHWMSVLARASLADLARLTSQLDLQPVEIVKAAEIGTIMVEGRAGGGGRRFNAGEATLTRCVVRDGERIGFAYALGRDKAKALLCARLDALLQDDAQTQQLMTQIITPLAQAQQRRRETASRRAAATKVEFFTMVRGDG